MRQTLGKKEQHLNAQAGAIGAPTGDVGIAMSAFSGAAKVSKHLLTVQVGGTGSIEVALYGRPTGGLWGALGNKEGKVNDGTALTAGNTYHFEIENLGAFERVFTRTLNATSSPTTSTWLQEILERGD